MSVSRTRPTRSTALSQKTSSVESIYDLPVAVSDHQTSYSLDVFEYPAGVGEYDMREWNNVPQEDVLRAIEAVICVDPGDDNQGGGHATEGQEGGGAVGAGTGVAQADESLPGRRPEERMIDAARETMSGLKRGYDDYVSGACMATKDLLPPPRPNASPDYPDTTPPRDTSPTPSLQPSRRKRKDDINNNNDNNNNDNNNNNNNKTQCPPRKRLNPVRSSRHTTVEGSDTDSTLSSVPDTDSESDLPRSSAVPPARNAHTLSSSASNTAGITTTPTSTATSIEQTSGQMSAKPGLAGMPWGLPVDRIQILADHVNTCESCSPKKACKPNIQILNKNEALITPPDSALAATMRQRPEQIFYIKVVMATGRIKDRSSLPVVALLGCFEPEREHHSPVVMCHGILFAAHPSFEQLSRLVRAAASAMKSVWTGGATTDDDSNPQPAQVSVLPTDTQTADRLQERFWRSVKTGSNSEPESVTTAFDQWVDNALDRTTKLFSLGNSQRNQWPLFWMTCFLLRTPAEVDGFMAHQVDSMLPLTDDERYRTAIRIIYRGVDCAATCRLTGCPLLHLNDLARLPESGVVSPPPTLTVPSIGPAHPPSGKLVDRHQSSSSWSLHLQPYPASPIEHDASQSAVAAAATILRSCPSVLTWCRQMHKNRLSSGSMSSNSQQCKSMIEYIIGDEYNPDRLDKIVDIIRSNTGTKGDGSSDDNIALEPVLLYFTQTLTSHINQLGTPTKFSLPAGLASMRISFSIDESAQHFDGHPWGITKVPPSALGEKLSAATSRWLETILKHSVSAGRTIKGQIKVHMPPILLFKGDTSRSYIVLRSEGSTSTVEYRRIKAVWRHSRRGEYKVTPSVDTHSDAGWTVEYTVFAQMTSKQATSSFLFTLK